MLTMTVAQIENFPKLSRKKKVLRIYCRYLGLVIMAIWEIKQAGFYVTDSNKMKSWQDEMYMSFEKLQCTLQISGTVLLKSDL